ncbi:hypothetical protein EDC48_12516 [Gibbsiella quercinecans]|nr:hypothetical protein EDC48_12516 [Gibbsiella quercinecans]
MKKQWLKPQYPSYSKLQIRWLYYSAHPWASPRWGRCQQRSNLLPADLSLTSVTYLCKLLGIRCVAAFLQLELFWV